MLDILFSKLYVISQLTIGPSYFLHRESCLLNSFAETQNMKYTMMIWKYITPYILRSAIKNDAHDGKTTCNLNAMKSGIPPDFLTCCRNFAITMSYIVAYHNACLTNFFIFEFDFGNFSMQYLKTKYYVVCWLPRNEYIEGLYYNQPYVILW